MKLFTRILTLCAICLALAAQAQANYRAKAIQTTEWIQRNFYDAAKKIYRPSTPLDPKGLPYDVMWANGVQFSVLSGGARYEAKYRALMGDFAQGLEKYWDKDAAVPGFDAYFSSRDNDDKYYDDNAWLVLGFAEAYRTTRDPLYLNWARRTQNFVLSGWDDKLGGGIYWYQNKRDSKNTCINAPAAAAALELYELTGNRDDLAWAQKLYTWTNANLQDSDGLYWDNIKLDGTVERYKWTYNTALMIRTNVGLYRALKDPRYLQEARRVSDAALARWADKQTGAFADSARFNHLFSEAILQTYEATRDLKYLNAVRRHADFGYRFVRDAQNGGFWNEWKVERHAADERKTLIENASVARLFWMLAPYPDLEQLQERAALATARGDAKSARALEDQLRDSTASAPAPVAPAQT